MLVFAESDSHAAPVHDASRQKEVLTRLYAGGGWETDEMLHALQASTDLYFDRVSQIVMPSWTKGAAHEISSSIEARISRPPEKKRVTEPKPCARSLAVDDCGMNRERSLGHPKYSNGPFSREFGLHLRKKLQAAR
jgi:hypothetical protein